MKRFSLILMTLALCGGGTLRAQDAATEERLKKLTGLVQDIQDSKEAQRKQIEGLAREIQSLREQASKPTGNYASQDDLRDLAKKLQEIDRKRIDDNERIVKEIEKLGKTITKAGSTTTTRPPRGGNSDSGSDAPKGTKDHSNEDGFEYTVKEGDFLSTIVQAYNKEGVKVKVDDVLKANPGLVPSKMKPGTVLWIPGKKSK